MKRKHPDAKLTLRQAYLKYYDRTELRKATADLHRFILNRWEKSTNNPSIGKIDNALLVQFKQTLLDEGLAARTVNSYWPTCWR